MSRWGINFDSPAYLALLALVPVIWLTSRRSLAGLGRWRWFAANLLRTAVLILLVFALAQVQLLRTSEKVTVIYLLDQSESIPLEKRQAMLEFTVEAVARHRQKDRSDRAGVIVFGRTANIEIPPFDEDIQVLGAVDSYVNLRTDATNLEAALKLAKASFPEDSSKRIVIVTDGNENVGDARSVAASAAEDGIGVDVVPVRLTSRAEVAVEKLTLPTDIRQGQPIETRVVLNNYASHVVQGKLTVTRRMGGQDERLGDQDVSLQPGKNVYSFGHKIEHPAVYTYQADFTPLDGRDDLLTQNNRATAFTQVRGKGRVLLIEDWQHAGEFDYLVQRLRSNNIEVTTQTSDQLFTSLAELQAFDSVILANVPRSSGDDANSVSSFSDQQVDMLVRNTEQMGCGLIMLGGPNSYGAGGWSNTPLEKAMPVDFQINNSKIRAVGALVMIMHASEIAEGNYWQKQVAHQAIMSLGPMDYCGLIHWDVGGDTWLWRDSLKNGLIRVGPNRNRMLALLNRMTPGDMPEFDPSMKTALASLNAVPASVKLMIIISDGDPSQPSFMTVQGYKKANIQVTTVAIGAHGAAGHSTLQNLADATGGRYYVVTNPKALPKIYVSEVRRVSRPLVFEPESPVQPRVTYPHEILEGISGPLPPTKGFVLTTVKENPLVEVAAISPQPTEEKNATILAAWTYGLGRTAVLTTDAGHRWASAWTGWQNYDKFFTQFVRWSMRPVDERGKFTVASDVRDGKIRVVITALDKQDEFLNFLSFSAAAVDPELGSFDVKIQQVAPGRYIGEFDATKEGNYFITMNPGPGYGPLMTGVSVPYSAEYRERETNLALLSALARQRPKGGKAGEVIEGELRKGDLAPLLKVDPFRSGLTPAKSSRDVWPLALLVTALVFLADVFIRRVHVGFGWVVPVVTSAWQAISARRHDPRHEERLERLRSRKAEVGEAIDERRAATRFEPVVEAIAEDKSPDEVLREASLPPVREEPKRPVVGPSGTDTAAGPSYTERLLQAKKKAWQDRGDTPEPPPTRPPEDQGENVL